MKMKSRIMASVSVVAIGMLGENLRPRFGTICRFST